VPQSPYRKSSKSSSATMTTVSQLRAQWSDPGDVLSLLLIIGGDIIQKALAQSTAGRVPPVCFSFGWVAYSFTTLVGVIGDGRLLPPPDYPVKVFNLETAYMRENKNWILGRILRDNEAFMNKRGALNGAAFRISIYKAEDRSKKRRLFTSEIIWLAVTYSAWSCSDTPWCRSRVGCISHYLQWNRCVDCCWWVTAVEY
jgi:hypothetical protein